MDKTVIQSVNTASAVAGVGSALIFGASLIPAITVSPGVLTIAAGMGMTAGVYSVSRSVMNVYQMANHKEDISFQNEEARSAYLNILAGTLGFISAGATDTLSYYASNGTSIGQGTKLIVNSINLANIGASATNLANRSYQVVYDWMYENKSPSILSIMHLSSSVLFFGSAVYHFRTAGTIINEAQTNCLNSYSDSLRSNRHRKMFNKMTKETIRQQGNAEVGRLEVMSTLKNISNKDETFAILTRNNNLFNRIGVKFSSSVGEIKLNGMPMNLSAFGLMPKIQRTEILMNIFGQTMQN